MLLAFGRTRSLKARAPLWQITVRAALQPAPASRGLAEARVARLLALQAPRPFDERMPAEDQRNHETIHLHVAGTAVVDGRFITGGEVQVVVDLVTKGKAECDIIALVSLNTIDGGPAALVPGSIN